MQSIFNSISYKKSCANKSEKGFSLLELLVAIVVFMIIMGAIYGLLRVGRIDRTRASQRADVLKNARVAIHLMGRDALNSGLGYNRVGGVAPDDFLTKKYGFPKGTDDVPTNDGNTDRDILTAVYGGNDLFKNDLMEDTNGRTDTIGFVSRDMEFNDGEVVGLKGVASASGSAQVTTMEDKGATDAKVDKNQVFLLESPTSQVLIMSTKKDSDNTITFATGDPLELNQSLSGTGNDRSQVRKCANATDTNCTTYGDGKLATAVLKKISFVKYKVNKDGTLVRTVYGNNTGTSQIQDEILAYNVENLQVQYVIANESDPVVTDDPVSGMDKIKGNADDGPQNFRYVRQIMISVTVRSTEIDENTRKPMKVTLNATFSTRNLQYDAS